MSIELDQVTKELEGRTVLKGVSFCVHEGEVFGYLGPNGSGKTTTMRIILGLLRPTSGRALVFGEELSERDDLRKRVGVLLESDGLYERLSARENMSYYARLYSVPQAEKKITALLELMGLSDRQNDRVATFSKGMKRRLALARSLVNDPDMLLYDEPSSGLDPEALKMVRDLLIEMAKEEGRTIFLCSHDLDEVQRVCSKIAVLQKGEIRACDTIDNLRRSSDHFVEVSLRSNEEAERALDLLNSLKSARDSGRIGSRITVKLDGEDTSSILALLTSSGVRVGEVRSVTKSLEEIYLDIVHGSEERA